MAFCSLSPRPPLADRIRFGAISRLEVDRFDVFVSGDSGAFMLVTDVSEVQARIIAKRLNEALEQWEIQLLRGGLINGSLRRYHLCKDQYST